MLCRVLPNLTRPEAIQDEGRPLYKQKAETTQVCHETVTFYCTNILAKVLCFIYFFLQAYLKAKPNLSSVVH